MSQSIKFELHDDKYKKAMQVVLDSMKPAKGAVITKATTESRPNNLKKPSVVGKIFIEKNGKTEFVEFNIHKFYRNIKRDELRKKR